MNAEKYTQKALDAVKTAQSMAQENGNQYVTSEHLLYALLDQDGGLIGSLFGRYILVAVFLRHVLRGLDGFQSLLRIFFSIHSSSPQIRVFYN